LNSATAIILRKNDVKTAFFAKRIQNMRSISISTIKRKYPNEWVLLANPVITGIELGGGIVLSHHKDKRELAIQGRALIGGYDKYQVIYTGKLPRIPRLGILRTIKNV
jgi:hypothetical protein